MVQYGDVPKPHVTGPHDVVVKVRCAVLNPADAKMRSGNIKLFGPKKFPAITGLDFAGTVCEQGSAVTAFQLGDAVYGTVRPFVGGGTCAQYVLVDTKLDKILPKPANISFAEAAALGTALTTSWVALKVLGGVDGRSASSTPTGDGSGAKKETSVLVIGASGGCGHIAVQLARNAGCKVLAVCSKRNEAWVRELGASVVLDYTSGPLPSLLSKSGVEQGSLDLALDFVGGDAYYSATLPFLKKGAKYVTATGPVEHAGSKPVTLSQVLFVVSKLLYRCCFTSYRIVTSLPVESFAATAELVAEGKVRPKIAAEFPLERTAEGHELLETNRAAGRVVIVVDKE